MTSVSNTETVGTHSLVSEYEYTYNELGQRVDRAQSGSAVTDSTDAFQYDDLGQVIGSTNDVETTDDAWNPVYPFDRVGNRDGDIVDLNGTTSYTPDLLTQYDQIDADTPLYDADGNLTSRGDWTYTWNGENRLIKAENSVLSVSIDFEYDYQGRLVKKDDGTDLEVYLYDDWNRIAKYVNGSHGTSYLWGLDLSGSTQGAGGVGGLLKEGDRYPTFDANGNIVQKLNSSGGTDMAVAYDPFGNVIDGTLVAEYGFSTKPLVDDLDFYYYGFRYYDPVTGRWPSRDPIEEEGGLNLYAMVGNNPINAWDYRGLFLQYVEYSDGELTVNYDNWTGTVDSDGGTVRYSVQNTMNVPLGSFIGSFEYGASLSANFSPVDVGESECSNDIGSGWNIDRYDWDAGLRNWINPYISANSRLSKGNVARARGDVEAIWYGLFINITAEVNSAISAYYWSEDFCKCFRVRGDATIDADANINPAGIIATGYAVATSWHAVRSVIQSGAMPRLFLTAPALVPLFEF